MKIAKISLSVILLISLLSSCNNQKSNQLNNQNLVSTLSDNKTKITKPDVIEIKSPNQSDRAEGSEITAIVLHHTASAGDAKAVGRFFSNPKAQVSAHYTVDRTGYIVQSVPDEFKSWHAGRSSFQGEGNVNNFSIGIEICNLGDSKEIYSEEQYDGIIKLVGHLSSKYNIPITRITRHRDIGLPKGRKIDTSNNFSVEKVTKGVTSLLNGTYKSPEKKTYKSISYPDYHMITTKKDENTLEIIADKYLDNPNRWEELEMINPQFSKNKEVPTGFRVKIPNHYNYFYRLNK